MTGILVRTEPPSGSRELHRSGLPAASCTARPADSYTSPYPAHSPPRRIPRGPPEWMTFSTNAAWRPFTTCRAEGLALWSRTGTRDNVSRLMPRMLLDLQNRGQLAAGHDDLQPGPRQAPRHLQGDRHGHRGVPAQPARPSTTSIMEEYAGRRRHRPRPLRHLRGQQPQLRPAVRAAARLQVEVVRFAFNGQLANFAELRDELLANHDYHLTRDNDTEVIMHYISHEHPGRRPAGPGRGVPQPQRRSSTGRTTSSS